MHELEAAIRKFPGQVEAVRRLAQSDDAFCDMCEELAAAETALAGLRNARTSPDRERREECEGWIVRLVAEMTEALDRSGTGASGSAAPPAGLPRS